MLENPQNQVIVNEALDALRSAVQDFLASEIMGAVLMVNVSGQGSVEEKDGEDVLGPNEGDGNEYKVSVGKELTLITTTVLEWEFEQWSGDLAGIEGTETIIMDEDKEVTATFIEILSVVTTVEISEEESIDIPGV